VRRGTHNFDRITVKIYKDNTARLEALKAGEFDMMRFYLRRRLGAAGERQASRPANWSRASSSTSCRPASRATC
jgi:ABC-type transport system substrate-binding protein